MPTSSIRLRWPGAPSRTTCRCRQLTSRENLIRDQPGQGDIRTGGQVHAAETASGGLRSLPSMRQVRQRQLCRRPDARSPSQRRMADTTWQSLCASRLRPPVERSSRDWAVESARPASGHDPDSTPPASAVLLPQPPAGSWPPVLRPQLLPVQRPLAPDLRRAWAAVGLRVRQASAAPTRRCRRRVEAQAPRGAPSVQSAPAGTARPLRMRRELPPVVSPLASHRRPRLCRSSLPTPRWLRSLLLPRRLPLRRQSPTRLRHRPALPPAHLSGTPLLRHPRSALPQAPALRLLRPCHSDRRPHLHPQHLLRLPARRPRRPHRSDPASPPPPRPVQQALWERLRQYRFRPHAPSATQLPPPRPPVHCAVSPPAAVIRCSWPVASVPPSTPSPTWTSASSG